MGRWDKIIPENGPDMLNSSYIHMYLVRCNRELGYGTSCIYAEASSKITEDSD